MDGVITDPDVCNFKPQRLLCRPGTNDTSNCLTYDQLSALQYYYEPWVDTNDTWVWPGFPFGNELVSVFDRSMQMLTECDRIFCSTLSLKAISNSTVVSTTRMVILFGTLSSTIVHGQVI